MDSTLLSGCIGAFATILAAFISKTYVDFRIRTIDLGRPLDGLSRRILNVFSSFSVESARVFRLEEGGRAYINDRLGITVGLSSDRGRWVNVYVTVLGEVQQDLTFNIGSVHYYRHRETWYRIIYVEKVTRGYSWEAQTAYYLFEIREVPAGISPK